jgi:hypothetical protein
VLLKKLVLIKINDFIYNDQTVTLNLNLSHMDVQACQQLIKLNLDILITCPFDLRLRCEIKRLYIRNLSVEGTRIDEELIKEILI